MKKILHVAICLLLFQFSATSKHVSKEMTYGDVARELLVTAPPSDDPALKNNTTEKENERFGETINTLQVSATATAGYTRTIDWTIEKSVFPDNWDLFTGDRGISQFTIGLNKSVTDSEWVADGTIVITNNTSLDAVVTGVTIEISGFNGAISLDCAVIPFTLAAGASRTCSYSAALPDGTNRVNTVTVTTADGGSVGGDVAVADIVFNEPTTIIGESETITVADTNGETYGPFSDDATIDYEKTFACGEDAGANVNTASIVETGDADDAIVAVNCYGIQLSQVANTSFNRNWSWTISKDCTFSSPEEPLVVAPGQEYITSYSVKVEPTATDDSFQVLGAIIITNPHPNYVASLQGVTATINPGNLSVPVTCPDTFLRPGASMTCSYSYNPPDGAALSGTATITLQNFDFMADGTSIGSGTTDFSSLSTAITFDEPFEEIDACIDITDDKIGNLGIACASTSPSIFNYITQNVFIGPEECGPQTVTNTASFQTRDTGVTGSDDCAVYFDVACELGCTLSPGYWKTHNNSFQGGASKRADATWQLIQPDAEQSPFFLSGQSFYGVLWTPSRGNAYYILADAYIAAMLNAMNVDNEKTSSLSPEVNAALAQSQNFFAQYTPSNWPKNMRATLLDYAALLDDYNNGLIGPGKCDEDDDASEASSTKSNVSSSLNETQPGTELLLQPIWPNPVKNSATFGFNLPTAEKVQLRVFNMNGQLVSTVTDSYLEAGNYQMRWDVPENMSSGMYFYRIEAGSIQLTRRMLIMK